MELDLAPAIARIRQYLPDAVGAYVFGSAASGTMHAASDVDIAVLGRGPIDASTLQPLRERIAADLAREVDLIDLNAAPTVLQMQIVNEGRILDAADKTALGLFELRVLRDYRDLKRRRAGIDADIVARGRVHA